MCGPRPSSRGGVESSPRAGGAPALPAGVPVVCAWRLQPAWARVCDRGCPGKVGSGAKLLGEGSPGRRWRAERPPLAPGPGLLDPPCAARRVAARIQAQRRGATSGEARGVSGCSLSCSGTVVIADVDGNSPAACASGRWGRPFEGRRSGLRKHVSFDEGAAEVALGCPGGPALRGAVRAVTGSVRGRAPSVASGRTGRPRRSAGPESRRSLSPSGEHGQESGRSWRDGVNRISTRAEGAARRSRRGVQRFRGCSCRGSVAEVGERHLPERRSRCPQGLRQQRRVARVGRSA